MTPVPFPAPVEPDEDDLEPGEHPDQADTADLTGDPIGGDE